MPSSNLKIALPPLPLAVNKSDLSSWRSNNTSYALLPSPPPFSVNLVASNRPPIVATTPRSPLTEAPLTRNLSRKLSRKLSGRAAGREGRPTKRRSLDQAFVPPPLPHHSPRVDQGWYSLAEPPPFPPPPKAAAILGIPLSSSYPLNVKKTPAAKTKAIPGPARVLLQDTMLVAPTLPQSTRMVGTSSAPEYQEERHQPSLRKSASTLNISTKVDRNVRPPRKSSRKAALRGREDRIERWRRETLDDPKGPQAAGSASGEATPKTERRKTRVDWELESERLHMRMNGISLGRLSQGDFNQLRQRGEEVLIN